MWRLNSRESLEVLAADSGRIIPVSFLNILSTLAVFQIFCRLNVSSEVLRIKAKGLQAMSNRDFKTNG